jgi:hypothetical protein
MIYIEFFLSSNVQFFAGITMITETRITGGEVAAGVMIGMDVIGTVVGEIGTIAAEAEAEVPVPITSAVEGGAMMMSVIVEAGADQ